MSPRPAAPTQKALWGRQEPLPVAAPRPGGSNDLDLFAAIVKTATDPGYVLIGPADKPFVREPGTKHDVNPVPRYEAEAIAQMLDAGHLRIGGHHHVTDGRREGPAHSVLVPAVTRSMVARWAALHRLPHQRGAGDTPSTTAEHSGAAGGLWCPECGEPARNQPPTSLWPAGNGPRPEHSHPDGQPLCPVMTAGGYRPAQPTTQRPT